MKRLDDDHEIKACALDAVRRAVAEEGYGPESLAAHMGVSKGYVSKVLNGESALGLPFFFRLPTCIRKRVYQLGVEYHGGVVVWPDTDEKSALMNMLKALLSPAARAIMSMLPDAESERKVG